VRRFFSLLWKSSIRKALKIAWSFFIRFLSRLAARFSLSAGGHGVNTRANSGSSTSTALIIFSSAIVAILKEKNQVKRYGLFEKAVLSKIWKRKCHASRRYHGRPCHHGRPNQPIQTGGAKGEICRGNGRGKRGMKTRSGIDGSWLSDWLNDRTIDRAIELSSERPMERASICKS